ncbi:hypothetical protein [Neptunicella sp. SCSIO 80796]|uniref:hypothetical protein n=1 Tax=Neptunicella plasticusilytica TaxID=3117012 RepID=UPI003A4E390A
MMGSISQRSLSMLLSIGLLSLALCVMWLGRGFTVKPQESLTIREIAISTPPPPPPPPQVQQTQTNQNLTVQVQGQGAQMQVIDIPQPDIKVELPDDPQITSSQPQWQSLTIDWQAFELNDLDSFPNLLTPLRVKLPVSLSRRGVNKVLIKLDVVIDIDGQIKLLDIVENPYPELNSEINKMVRNSRFSPPQKDGAPVRARFIWPIEIKS